MKTTDIINIGSKILKDAKIHSHLLDTEVILSHLLKVNRERLLINEDTLTKKELSLFNEMISRRLKREPIAYIINKKEFRSSNLYV